MRNTLILIGIALALGAYVWFYEIGGEEERLAQKEEQELVFPVERDSLVWFKINDFEKEFVFEKRDGTWMIMQPVETRADESSVNSFLSTLTSAKRERSFGAQPADLGQYGLQEPTMKIYVRTQNGSSDSLFLGGASSVGNKTFVSKGDTLVSLIPQTLKTNASKTLFSWRDKKVLHFDKNKVREIALKTPQGEFRLAGNGGWHLEQPLETPADNDAVQAMLNKLEFGRIKSVETETASNAARYGLSRPAYRVELFSGPEKVKQEVAFSALKDGRAFGKENSQPHIFTVDSAFMAPFAKTLYDLRDKQLLRFDRTTVDHINLLYEGNLLRMVKDTSGAWQSMEGQPLKTTIVSQLLGAVADLKVDQFVKETTLYTFPYGLTNPRGTLELFANKDKIVELQIGNTENGRVYLRKPESGQIVAVNESKLDKILISEDEVVEQSTD